EYLFQQRLKNPYYGFWGLPSGKIRWGETIIQAAARESLEETGLSADFRIASIYHEHVIEHESGQIVEDKIFFMAIGTNISGTLITDFEGGHNEWLTVDEAMQKDKKYVTLETEARLLDETSSVLEQTITYTKQEF